MLYEGLRSSSRDSVAVTARIQMLVAVDQSTDPHGCRDPGLVLACSRRLFMQYYPRFTRFEAKTFLLEATASISNQQSPDQ
jgi:hypothetical protein